MIWYEYRQLKECVLKIKAQTPVLLILSLQASHILCRFPSFTHSEIAIVIFMCLWDALFSNTCNALWEPVMEGATYVCVYIYVCNTYTKSLLNF